MEKQPRSWKQLDECFQTMSGLVAVELLGRLSSRTKAAEQLNISVTALNSRLKTLEKRLKGPLVEKPRSSSLTPLAIALRRFWETSRSDVEQLFVDIEQLRNENELRLAIASSVWDAEREWLDAEFGKRMPAAEIHALAEDGYEAITHQVLEGIVDVGVVSFLHKDEKVPSPIARQFWRDEHMVLVVDGDRAETMNNAAIGPVELKHLHRTFFTLPENTRMYNAVSAYLRKNNIHKFFRDKVPVRDVASAIDEVAKGRGISILPEHAVKRAVRDKSIETFLLTPVLMCPLDLLYRHNSLKKGAVQAFLECISESKKRVRRFVSDRGLAHPGNARPSCREGERNAIS